MEKKKKHIFLKVLLALIIIIALIIMVPKWIKNYKEYKLFKDQYKTVKVENIKELKNKLPEEIKNADYSKDGMTNIEKAEKGLSIYSDDTDGDGLRDVDEINTYKSDPLKYSTAGDLYSDAYKVKNNLDIKKKIKEVPDIDVGVSGIKLIPKIATDANATYEKYKGKIPSDYNVIEEPFILYNFSGEVRYTLKEEAKNCEVYCYDRLTEKVNKTNSKSDGNDIIFKNQAGQPILITYKTSYIKKAIKGQLNSNLNYINTNKVEEEKQYFVVTSAIFNIFLGKPIQIYEYTNSPIKSVQGSDKSFETSVNTAIQTCFKDMFDKEDYEIAKKLNMLNLNVKHTYIGKFYGKILEMFAEKVDSSILQLKEENTNEDTNLAVSIKNLFFKTYKFTGTREELLEKVFGNEINKYMKNNSQSLDTLDTDISADKANGKNKTEEKKTRVLAESKFKIENNSFHFKNISTKASKGGVCAGMSYVVANAYNNKFVMDKNSEGDYTYDISDRDAFGCITPNNSVGNYRMGKILQTYANADPNDDAKIDENSDVQKNDIKLIRALNYFWNYSNNELFFKTMGDRLSSSTERDFSEIENLIKYIKQDKVAIIGFYCNDGGGHAINVYKVEQDLEDENVYYLRCYDNNLPLDTYIKSVEGGYTREKTEVVIKVIRNKYKIKSDTYSFSYDVFKNGKYVFGSAYGDQITFLTSELEKIK